ncbi:DUF2508 family protein [Acetivibrio cellulolyticus]|uniref:DUF2508 family protein n=1 Tax=Acetivibrio cellulolyticus TaxID=35830 RepID=UPI0001E2F0B3|nr:DUF2508 family protein [Acetivibrio cellulolyticus]
MNLNIQKYQRSKVQRNGIFQKILNSLNIKENSELEKYEVNDIQNLIDNITKAKKDWIKANADFDYAVEDDMIDYHTYKIKAYQARYEYLLKIAKEKGIRLEI